MAKAFGRMLRDGGMNVVFCDTCKQAYSQGDECPNCGGVLREVAGVCEGEKKLGEPFTPAVPIELDGSAKSVASMLPAPAVIESALSTAAPQALPDGISGGGCRGARWKITFNGKTQGVTAWARDLGIDGSLILARIAKRLPVDEVLAPSKRNAGELIEFQGERLSLFAWSRKLKIGYPTLRSRFEEGWSVERAFTEPVKIGRPPKAAPVAPVAVPITSAMADNENVAPYIQVAEELRANGGRLNCSLPEVEKETESLIEQCKRLVHRIDEIDAEIACLQAERERVIVDFKHKVKG